MVFIDLEKPYDRVPSQEFWRYERERSARKVCKVGTRYVQKFKDTCQM
jgi:hypothetical protein